MPNKSAFKLAHYKDTEERKYRPRTRGELISQLQRRESLRERVLDKERGNQRESRERGREQRAL